MNYLAHIFLAQQSDAAMIGALLGDFTKADISGIYPPEVEQEIMMHRQVDRYTDSHPVVKSALQLFDESRRRYAGILLDVFYDHVLAQRWASYSTTQRQAFIARFYQALLAHDAILPDKLRDIMPIMIEQDWLGRYYEFAGVEWAIQRISQRLTRNGHLLLEGLDDLRVNYTALAEGFDVFFPQLLAFVRERRAGVQAAQA